jgi:hypothetical protein
MTLKEALESLKLKFTSGNEIEVERATITREEFNAILKALNGAKDHHHDSDISNVGC